MNNTTTTNDNYHARINKEIESDKLWNLEHAQTSLKQFYHREGIDGFISFYHSTLEEYSSAEGGCFFVRRVPVACYPARNFWDTSKGYLDHALLEAEADRMGLTLEGAKVVREDGSERKVFGIRSACPEADCDVFLETYPFENACTITPRYE